MKEINGLTLRNYKEGSFSEGTSNIAIAKYADGAINLVHVYVDDGVTYDHFYQGQGVQDFKILKVAKLNHECFKTTKYNPVDGVGGWVSANKLFQVEAAISSWAWLVLERVINSK